VLLQCARVALDAERVSALRALAARADWDRVLDLAARHGLRPLLHRHASRACPDLVPADRLARLRDYFQKNGAFNLLLTGKLLQLLAVLGEHGVAAMPFKGPAIAASIYGHVALRQFCDLDVLVRERDVWRTSQVLEAQGFAPGLQVPAERRGTFVRHEYALPFHRDGGRTIVEVHWAVSPRAFGVRYDEDAIWGRAVAATLQGTPVRRPSDEDLLILLSVHGARHRWDKLENLVAIAELARHEALDWPYVWQQASRMHCRRMVAFALRLAHQLLDAPVPGEAHTAARSRSLDRLAQGVVRAAFADCVGPPNLARQALFYLRLKDGYVDRARACAGDLLLVTPDDWASVRLPGPLAVAYPLVRAARIARRHVKLAVPAGGGQ
jgi:hypothetical protein